MSSAELETWVRVGGVRPDDLRRALWDDRSLAKTWLMRSTLHIVPSEDLPLYSAAIGARRLRAPGFLKHVGVTATELDRAIAAVRDAARSVLAR